MAIRNIITGGIGLNNGQIGWAITSGFGSLAGAGASAVLYGAGIIGRFLRMGRRRKARR
jgi:hypothetical protein